LRPQVEPTGLALLALAGDNRADSGCVDRSLGYLQQAVSARTTPISLSWAVQALVAHDRPPALSGRWLAAAYRTTLRGDRSPRTISLLILAGLGRRSPLVAAGRLGGDDRQCGWADRLGVGGST